MIKKLLPALVCVALLLPLKGIAAITDPSVQTALAEIKRYTICQEDGAALFQNFLNSHDFSGATTIGLVSSITGSCADWSSASPVTCLYNGVTCENNNVTGLDLPWLTKIPPEISHLSNLKSLTLLPFILSGSLPSEIGDLGELTSLSIELDETILPGLAIASHGEYENYDAGLTGDIPIAIGNLTKLETLKLSNNSLTGSIPSEIGSLTLLTTLELSGNKLTGALPTSIGALSQLETFKAGRVLERLSIFSPSYLRDNHFTGEIPSGLWELEQLVTLDLAYNNLEGDLPLEVLDLSLLSVGVGINLKGNQLFSSEESVVTFVEFDRGASYKPQLLHTLPTSNAGDDLWKNESTLVTVDGIGTVSTGLTASYLWTQTAGTLVTLVNADTASVQFEAPDVTEPEVITLQLRVRDSFSRSAYDTVNINVKEPADIFPLQANAGKDQIAEAGQLVILDGSKSVNPDQNIVVFSWLQISGPTVVLADADMAAAQFVVPEGLGNTLLTFQLTVENDLAETANDRVLVDIIEPELREKLNIGNGSLAISTVFLLCVLSMISVFRRFTPRF